MPGGEGDSSLRSKLFSGKQEGQTRKCPSSRLCYMFCGAGDETRALRSDALPLATPTAPTLGDSRQASTAELSWGLWLSINIYSCVCKCACVGVHMA